MLQVSKEADTASGFDWENLTWVDIEQLIMLIFIAC